VKDVFVKKFLVSGEIPLAARYSRHRDGRKNKDLLPTSGKQFKAKALKAVGFDPQGS
jgi:hypothetical protein